ncbi:hypothetical protein GCM10027295_14780 [Pseudaeromonas pectinilytica]
MTSGEVQSAADHLQPERSLVAQRRFLNHRLICQLVVVDPAQPNPAPANLSQRHFLVALITGHLATVATTNEGLERIQMPGTELTQGIPQWDQPPIGK